MEETYSLSKPVKEEIIEETSSKENWYERKPKKPRRSIDLNRPASEEDQDQDKAEIEDVPEKQGLEEYRTIIEDLRQHNQRLEVSQC
jgi:hypothetical protein